MGGAGPPAREAEHSPQAERGAQRPQCIGAVTGLRRTYRRACTDVAARMRLPAWEHLRYPLRTPLGDHTVADLLDRLVVGHLSVVDAVGGAAPLRSELPERPTDAVIEAVRAALRALPAGEVPPSATDTVRVAAAEAVVLGWDLQQAILAGADPDPILVADVLPWVWTGAVTLWPGLPHAEEPPDADAVDRLLAAAGRRPSR